MKTPQHIFNVAFKLKYDEIKLLGFGHRHQFSFHNHHQLALDYMKEAIAEDIGNARQFCIC